MPGPDSAGNTGSGQSGVGGASGASGGSDSHYGGTTHGQTSVGFGGASGGSDAHYGLTTHGQTNIDSNKAFGEAAEKAKQLRNQNILKNSVLTMLTAAAKGLLAGGLATIKGIKDYKGVKDSTLAQMQEQYPNVDDTTLENAINNAGRSLSPSDNSTQFGSGEERGLDNQAINQTLLGQMSGDRNSLFTGSYGRSTSPTSSTQNILSNLLSGKKSKLSQMSVADKRPNINFSVLNPFI